MIEQIVFLVLAVVAVVGALLVVIQKSPLYNALALVLTFAAFAGIYITLNAQFIAAIQIIVYAGAIIVLFVFVIMLLNVRSEESRLDRGRVARWLALPFAVVLLAVTLQSVWALPQPAESPAQTAARLERSARVGTVETIGRSLFTKYLLPFEATSILILMAIVGSMVLARRQQEYVEPEAPEVEEDEPEEPEAPVDESEEEPVKA